MARDTFENWIADEKATNVIQVPNRGSAVELVSRKENMATDTKQVPRSGGFTAGVVAKGAAYGESTSTNDFVELIARKIGGVERIAVEDLNDSNVDILAAKRVDAAVAMTKLFDNATLGTNAAANGTTVPYTSVYYTVTNAGLGNNVNHVSSAGAVDYADLVAVLGRVGGGDWGDDLVIIAHPSFKFDIMSLTGNGVPLIQGGLENGYGGQELLGFPVVWTTGAKVSATATAATATASGVKGTTGNPLLIVANRNLLITGVANLPGLSGGVPGYDLQLPTNGVGYLTDEALMKAAFRRGFAVGMNEGVAVLEKTSA